MDTDSFHICNTQSESIAHVLRNCVISQKTWETRGLFQLFPDITHIQDLLEWL